MSVSAFAPVFVAAVSPHRQIHVVVDDLDCCSADEVGLEEVLELSTAQVKTGLGEQ